MRVESKAIPSDLADTHRAKLQSPTASTLAICYNYQQRIQWAQKTLQSDVVGSIVSASRYRCANMQTLQ